MSRKWINDLLRSSSTSRFLPTRQKGWQGGLMTIKSAPILFHSASDIALKQTWNREKNLYRKWCYKHMYFMHISYTLFTHSNHNWHFNNYLKLKMDANNYKIVSYLNAPGNYFMIWKIMPVDFVCCCVDISRSNNLMLNVAFCKKTYLHSWINDANRYVSNIIFSTVF